MGTLLPIRLAVIVLLNSAPFSSRSRRRASLVSLPSGVSSPPGGGGSGGATGAGGSH